MNRYQKPEVYERLAMEYSLGTLHGLARKRFERLMEQYPYMAAIVEIHDKDFASLADLLPEVKPDPVVWNKISAHIDAQVDAQVDQKAKLAATKGSSDYPQGYDQVVNQTGSQGILDALWNVLLNKGLMTAMVLLVVASVFIFKMGAVASPTAFSAILLSANSHQPMATVDVQKSNMKMKIKLIGPVNIPEGMKAVFWCIARDKSIPMMNMGTVDVNGLTVKTIQKATWRGIAEASQFAVSIEPVDAVTNSSPSGELIFQGKIKALTKA